ncbi:MAG: HPr family phosphocarrier protein, partial [Enterobacterales bacterium]|nr:HPr family phosphocarrier protein [Enterobacterales bacterium]
MSQVLKFTCELPNGVHARPASHIETLCNQFTANIEWLNLRTGRKGDAKSALALIGTDTLHGDACHIMIEGADAEQALERLSSFIKDEFPHCDAPLPQVAQTQDEELPQSLT